MTDNGSCYRSKLFHQACTAADLEHIRTRPYPPPTNGTAERLIQTSLWCRQQNGGRGLEPGGASLAGAWRTAHPSRLALPARIIGTGSWRSRSWSTPVPLPGPENRLHRAP